LILLRLDFHTQWRSFWASHLNFEPNHLMNKRTFLRSFLAIAAFTAFLSAPVITRAADATGRQYFELRTYTTKSGEQQKMISDYWRNAGIPAYGRLGFGPVGVFTEVTDSPTNHVYVLIPHESLGSFGLVHDRLAADAAYQKAAADYLDAIKANVAYVRFESSLSLAFEGMKTLEVPVAPAEGQSRIFELRIYESPSEGKGDNKVKMFNSGEIPLMKDVGLAPIFFGQAITGEHMPNLIYMLSGENDEAHKKHWKGFFDAPMWKKLSGDPQFKDNVTKVISIFLKRVPGSQI